MKKKAVAVVMTAVMALGMVSAVSVQAGIEDKTLIVGFDAEYPPYGYMDENGEYTGVAKYQLNSRGEGFKILDETLNTEQYAIGFKKGNTELCDIVNADLQKLADDGTVAELAEKYEIADMVTLKASDDASAEDSKDATDDAETDKTEEK